MRGQIKLIAAEDREAFFFSTFSILRPKSDLGKAVLKAVISGQQMSGGILVTAASLY